MKGIRQLRREKFSPIHLIAGDSIVLEHRDAGKTTRLVEHTADRSMTFDEGVIFEADAEVFGRPAIGGAFIEAEK